MPKIPNVWTVTIIVVCVLGLAAAAALEAHLKTTGTLNPSTNASQNDAAGSSALPVISAESSMQPGSVAGGANLNPQESVAGPTAAPNAAALQSGAAPNGTENNTDPTLHSSMEGLNN